MGKLRLQQDPLQPSGYGAEGIAGGENQVEAISMSINAGLDPVHVGFASDAVDEGDTVITGDSDEVARHDLLEEVKMRITVPSNDGRATLPRAGSFMEKGRAEAERLAATAREHNGTGLLADNVNARYWPRIHPTPGFHGNACRNRLVEGAFLQGLGKQSWPHLSEQLSRFLR